MSDDQPNAEYVVETIDGADVQNWRIINAGNVGKLFKINKDGSQGDSYNLLIRLDTVDVDGRNPVEVQFGMNRGAIESIVGSIALNLIDEDDEAEKIRKATAVFDLFFAAINAMNSDGQHDPNCPRHKDHE